MIIPSRRTSLLAAFALAAVVAGAIPAVRQTLHADALPNGAAAAAEPVQPDTVGQEPARQDNARLDSWDAVAPGRVEPKSREVRVSASLPARIAEVAVKPGDAVTSGDLLVRLDDDEALARLAAADAQVALRKRARNEAGASSSTDRRKAEDAAADAERAAADAQAALDKLTADWRAGTAPRAELDAARTALSQAQSQFRERRDALQKLKANADTALPTRLEGELNVARAEWTLALSMLEKTRIRAPSDGTVLQAEARKGELALPAVEPSLMIVGDTSGMRVRAEVDEQHRGRIRPGQRVLVRSAAWRDRTFEGKVASIARIVGPSRINARTPRKLTDIDVLEVVIDLSDTSALVVGELVDVYFSADPAQTAAAR